MQIWSYNHEVANFGKSSLEFLENRVTRIEKMWPRFGQDMVVKRKWLNILHNYCGFRFECDNNKGKRVGLILILNLIFVIVDFTLVEKPDAKIFLNLSAELWSLEIA